MKRVRLTVIISICCTLLLVSSCSSVEKVTTDNLQNLVWPEPPSAARIQFLRSFSQPQQLGISKGFWQSVADFFSGGSDYRLIRPMDIVVDNNGVIYVSDPGVQGVHRFDVKKNSYRILRRQNDQGLPSPIALALGEDNTIYVTDSQLSTVFRYQHNDKQLVPVELDSAIYQPTGIAYNPQTHTLYITDTTVHRILGFNSQGKLVQEFGSRGLDEGQFNYPTFINIDQQQQIYVTDSLNFRVQVFTATGKFVRSFGNVGDGSGNMARPKGIATDSDQHVYVIDGLFHVLQVFNQQGQLLLPVGDRGSDAGQFWLPVGIYIEKNGTIYVADSHNQRVQVFRYLGGQS